MMIWGAALIAAVMANPFDPSDYLKKKQIAGAGSAVTISATAEDPLKAGLKRAGLDCDLERGKDAEAREIPDVAPAEDAAAPAQAGQLPASDAILKALAKKAGSACKSAKDKKESKTKVSFSVQRNQDQKALEFGIPNVTPKVGISTAF